MIIYVLCIPILSTFPWFSCSVPYCLVVPRRRSGGAKDVVGPFGSCCRHEGPRAGRATDAALCFFCVFYAFQKKTICGDIDISEMLWV